MIRRPLRAVLATTLLSLSLAPAALATSGSLTASEYQQLSRLNTRLNHLSSKSSESAIRSDLRTCDKTRAVSQLVTVVRADCGSVFNVLGAMLNLGSVSHRCVREGAGAYNCILSTYRKLYDRTSEMYGADLHARSVVLARGLGAVCASNLAEPPKVITFENRLTSAAAQLVIDVKSHQGKALEGDSAAYTKDFNKVIAASGSGSILDGCAHQ
jgi:hypothetical protein